VLLFSRKKKHFNVIGIPFYSSFLTLKTRLSFISTKKELIKETTVYCSKSFM